MLNKYSLLILLLMTSSSMTTVANAEISTLFTTPQERQLINANRYKSDEVKPLAQENDAPSAAESIQQLVQEEVRETITISGITLSNSGPNMAWINSQAYEDGDSMGDKMRIKVMPGNELKVRITAPDGKHYFATSGETLEIVYQAAVEN